MSLTERDIEYRAALGITDDEPLPNAIGQCRGHSAPASRARYYASKPPPNTDLGACDTVLRLRRLSATLCEADGTGNLETDLADYDEAITNAKEARDNAKTAAARLAAGAYVVKLQRRREAIIAQARGVEAAIGTGRRS